MELIVLIIIAVAIGGGIWLFRQASGYEQRSFWTATFEHLARRYNGSISSGGFSGPAVLRFSAGQCYARLTSYHISHSSSPRVVELVIQYPDVVANIDIVRRNQHTRLLATTPYMYEVVVDNFSFSREWALLSNSPAEAGKVVNAEVAMHLERVYRVGGWTDVAISLRPGWMLIRKRWKLSSMSEVDAWVGMALTLHTVLQLTRGEGIDFIEPDSSDATVMLNLTSAQCKICGEGLTQAVVFCSRCLTPHHQDCWEYAGGCSTFACKETQYQYALPPRPVVERAAANPLPPARDFPDEPLATGSHYPTQPR